MSYSHDQNKKIDQILAFSTFSRYFPLGMRQTEVVQLQKIENLKHKGNAQISPCFRFLQSQYCRKKKAINSSYQNPKFEKIRGNREKNRKKTHFFIFFFQHPDFLFLICYRHTRNSDLHTHAKTNRKSTTPFF